ncbi:MAG: tetratricopeptide repeat protein [Lentisphaerae bacterium]|nr:tetratricopeptide repeat protein [Lentisphaerota bacterium]
MSVTSTQRVLKQASGFIEKGLAALERNNLDYAMEMFKSAVDADPDSLKARKYLRAVSLKKFKEKPFGKVVQTINTIVAVPSLIKAFIQLKTGKAEKALEVSESLLSKDPLNHTFLKIATLAAEGAKMQSVATLTLEIAVEHFPDNLEFQLWMGKTYLRTDMLNEAQEIFTRIVDMNPSHSEAKSLLKDAMAASTLSKGWSQASDEGGSYELVRDSKETATLEHEGRLARGEHATEFLIKETLQKIEREPKNINYRRTLANLYVEHNEFDQAIATLQETLELTGADPQTEKTISDIQIKQFEKKIKDVQASGNIEEAEKLIAERQAFLLDNARSLVERYPNDLQLHFQYGKHLFENGMFDETIQEMQIAQRNSQLRAEALYFLGMCFKNKDQLDIAQDQLIRALEETPDMNKLKKGIIYELGSIAEALGDSDAAINRFKEIYQVDIQYKDVAAKIERAYRK